MANVTVHHSKQEWERHNQSYPGVCLLVCRNGVLVYDLLEHSSELVCLEVGWGVKLVSWNLLQL